MNQENFEVDLCFNNVKEIDGKRCHDLFEGNISYSNDDNSGIDDSDSDNSDNKCEGKGFQPIIKAQTIFIESREDLVDMLKIEEDGQHILILSDEALSLMTI